VFKLGIVTTGGLDRPRTMLGRERHASLLLLHELAKEKCTRPELYDEVVRRVRLPNGTWRQTASGRLAQLDEALLALLAQRTKAGSHVSVLDLAVSTGVTSVELYHKLRARYDVEFTASDLFRDLYAVSSRRSRWSIVLDANLQELQYVVGRFVLPAHLSESALYPVNRIVKRLARRFALPAAREALREAIPVAASSSFFEPCVVGDFEVRRLPFMSFDCLRLKQASNGFKFEVIDLCRPIAARADVVRAMNIVTPENFDRESARAIIANCVAAVRPGGMLLMGYSKGLASDDVQGTIYQVVNGRVNVLQRLNGGCPYESLAVGNGVHQ
jgi:hypothetical protein